MVLAARYHLDAFLAFISALKTIVPSEWPENLCELSHTELRSSLGRPRVRTIAASFIGVGAIDNFLVSDNNVQIGNQNDFYNFVYATKDVSLNSITYYLHVKCRKFRQRRAT